MTSAKRWRPETQRLLLLSSTPGIDLNAHDTELCSKPLIYAVRYSTIGVVRRLLQAKADPNVCDASGYVIEANLTCYRMENVEVLKLLLEHRGDPNYVSIGDPGFAGYSCGVRGNKNFDIGLGRVALLLEHKADPDFANLNGTGIKHPFHSAAESDCIDTALLMVAHKADVNRLVDISSGVRVTPLEAACAELAVGVARVLIDAGAKYEGVSFAADLDPDGQADELLLWMTEGWRPERHTRAPGYIGPAARTMMVLSTIPGNVVYTLPSELLFIVFALLPCP